MNQSLCFHVSSGWRVALLCAGFGLTSGHALAGPATIKPVEEKTPLAFPAGETGRIAVLRQVKTRYESPGFIGESQSGWLCGRRGDIAWTQATSGTLLPVRAMAARFRTELENAHYPVTVVSDSMFEEKKEGAPPDAGGKDKLQVGVFIKEISLNLCAKGNNSWTGETYLKLFWQVFAPEQKKVVFEATTEGSFQVKDAPVTGLPSAITIPAFAMAVRNMLADPGFSKVVSTPADPELLGTAGASKSAYSNAEKLEVDGAVGNEEPLPQKVTQLRSAVATVVADGGTGSGFFIGKSGLLLTNQHVVGKTKFVKVRLATGRELIGEVVRSDDTRDVALVKTEPAGVPPIPVRLTDPAIGEDVFALGSPLGEKFNTTLTKGILGGIRELNQQNYLQSDVAILPGNSGGPLLDHSGQVIGITVMGLGAKGLAGMNFFVPVTDALEKLGLKLTTSK